MPFLRALFRFLKPVLVHPLRSLAILLIVAIVTLWIRSHFGTDRIQRTWIASSTTFQRDEFKMRDWDCYEWNLSSGRGILSFGWSRMYFYYLDFWGPQAGWERKSAAPGSPIVESFGYRPENFLPTDRLARWGFWRVDPRDAWDLRFMPGTYHRIASYAVPHWALLLPLMLFVSIPWLIPRIRASRRRARKLCVACGYDLRAQHAGTGGDKCPECGTPFGKP